MLVFLAALLVAQATGFEALARDAAAARDANRLADALSLYQKALKLRPNWDEGWWNAGSIAYDTDRFADCIAAFRRLRTLKPDLAPAWIMSGLCEYGLHDYVAALRSLLESERLHFDGPPELSHAARLHLAIVLTKTGSFEKAIVLLTGLTRMDRKTPEISVAAGIAALRKPWTPSEVPEAEREKVGKTGDAMSTAMEVDSKGAAEKFQTVVNQYPDDADIHFRFGAYLMQQEPEHGIQEIRKALELNPLHVPALLGLAMIYIRNGEPQAAREYAERAVTANPLDEAAHVVLGRQRLESDDVAGAVHELEEAARLAPDSVEAHFSLASAYSRAGRREDAQREQEKFKRLRSAQAAESGAR